MKSLPVFLPASLIYITFAPAGANRFRPRPMPGIIKSKAWFT